MDFWENVENELIFQGKFVDANQIVELVKVRLAYWVKPNGMVVVIPLMRFFASQI